MLTKYMENNCYPPAVLVSACDILSRTRFPPTVVHLSCFWQMMQVKGRTFGRAFSELGKTLVDLNLLDPWPCCS
jgi:hypothetical protein